MTSRERLLATITHQEPDRVPIAPRVWAWLLSEYGDDSLACHMEACPDMDQMYVIDHGTPNFLASYPDTYDLPEVSVIQKKSTEGELTVIERTFQTPAGPLSDRATIPPAGKSFGVSPNPLITEHLIKSRGDLAALEYILPPINSNFEHLQRAQREVAEHGVIMVTVNSSLDYHAGYARDMQDLMMDFHEDRSLFIDLLEIFHRRSLDQIRTAFEGGAEFIIGTWFFNSLSSGWSPTIFEEVFVPQIREQVSLTHQYGAITTTMMTEISRALWR